MSRKGGTGGGGLVHTPRGENSMAVSLLLLLMCIANDTYHMHAYIRTYIHTYIHTYVRMCVHMYVPRMYDGHTYASRTMTRYSGAETQSEI